MRKNIKSASRYLPIIGILIGFMMKNASDDYQLIFLGVLISLLLYEIIKMIKLREDRDKIYFLISTGIFGIVMIFMIIGKNYLNISEMIQDTIIIISFIGFILAMIIFSLRIAIKSGDRNKVKKIIIGASALAILVLFGGLLVVFVSRLGY